MTRATLLLTLLTLAAAPSPPLVTGIDHIPLAVQDLARATADFERLGFTLKPGRPHTDGIRNAHIKFPDHTELELITAQSPTDALAADYTNFLKSGDGPAFWSLRAPNLPALTQRLAALHIAPTNHDDLVTFPQSAFPHRLFFADSPASPTDTPATFQHPNTAYHLQAIWLAGASDEAHLAQTLGAQPTTAPICAPFARQAETLTLQNGDIIVTGATPHRAPGRTIIGATILVKSLPTAAAILTHNHIRTQQTAGCGSPSLWISPTDAHHVWLQLRE